MSSRARKDVIPPAPLEYEMVMQYRDFLLVRRQSRYVRARTSATTDSRQLVELVSRVQRLQFRGRSHGCVPKERTSQGNADFARYAKETPMNIPKTVQVSLQKFVEEITTEAYELATDVRVCRITSKI